MVKKFIIAFIFGLNIAHCDEDFLSQSNDYAYYMRRHQHKAGLSKIMPNRKLESEKEVINKKSDKKGIRTYAVFDLNPVNYLLNFEPLSGGIRVFHKDKFIDITHSLDRKKLSRISFCHTEYLPNLSYVGCGALVYNFANPVVRPSVCLGAYLNEKTFIEVSFPFTIRYAYEL